MTTSQFYEIFHILCNWNYEDEERIYRNNTLVNVYAKGCTHTFNGHDFEKYNFEDWRNDAYDDDANILIGCNSDNVITFIPLSEIVSIQIKILPDKSKKIDSVDDLLKEIFTEGLKGTLKENEKENILKALAECDGCRNLTAKKLGISERTLYRRLKDYGIN